MAKSIGDTMRDLVGGIADEVKDAFDEVVDHRNRDRRHRNDRDRDRGWGRDRDCDRDRGRDRDRDRDRGRDRDGDRDRGWDRERRRAGDAERWEELSERVEALTSLMRSVNVDVAEDARERQRS